MHPLVRKASSGVKDDRVKERMMNMIQLPIIYLIDTKCVVQEEEEEEEAKDDEKA